MMLGKYPRDLVERSIEIMLDRFKPPLYRDSMFPAAAYFTEHIRVEWEERKKRLDTLRKTADWISFQRHLAEQTEAQRVAQKAKQPARAPLPREGPKLPDVSGPLHMDRPTPIVLSLPLTSMPVEIRDDVAMVATQGDDMAETMLRAALMRRLVKAGIAQAVMPNMIGLINDTVRVRVVDAAAAEAVMKILKPA
jgi:hypothetical protein